MAGRAHWLTCAVDQRDHAVLAHDPESGAHRAACGRTVWACSLASPPAARCPECSVATGDRTPDRRPTLVDRLLGLRPA